MIYRILCEGREDNPFFLDIWENSDESKVGRRRLMGAYAAGAMGWGTLPLPHIGIANLRLRVLKIHYRSPKANSLVRTDWLSNCRETFLGSSPAVQQELEGGPVLLSNAKEVEIRLDGSELTSSVEPQRHNGAHPD
jgi:hypothetical protein